ncbi:MAG TPA: carotenoid biosynthesis protein [Thermodesulfovibrionales bacterium]|nr:carotenoid biosynthesis protein [Thermodesulfovibrionales bacterium]
MEFFPLLFHTVVLRPYVFVFLGIYLFGCSMHLGLKRALLFFVAGYLIAWVSEYSSIHNGIPYGYYYYIEHTKGLELWVLGVPFMDSLSYIFLAYAGYSMALMVIAPVLYSGRRIYLLETKKVRNSLYARFLGTLFFVYLDIIIDPVALQGHKWFLGQVYGYPEKGVYFGVPISNFIGWFLVGFLMIYVLQKIDRFLDTCTDYAGYKLPWRYLIGPGLYFGILIFNLSVTFAIEEYHMGWVGVFIVLLPIVLGYHILTAKRSSEEIRKAIELHLQDFPLSAVPKMS